MYFRKFKGFLFLLGIAIIQTYGCLESLFAEDKKFKGSDVVATVYENKIHYKDIECPMEKLITEGIDKKEIKKEKKKRERKFLEYKIRRMTLLYEAEKREVEITKKDAIKWAEKYYSQEMIESSKNIYKIYEMIKEIYCNPESKDEVLNKIVKKFGMTAEQKENTKKFVEQILQNHKSVKNIERLQKDLCLNKEEVYRRVMYPDPYTGMHYQAISEKLKEEISKDITISDKEVDENFNKEYPITLNLDFLYYWSKNEILLKKIETEISRKLKHEKLGEISEYFKFNVKAEGEARLSIQKKEGRIYFGHKDLSKEIKMIITEADIIKLRKGQCKTIQGTSKVYYLFYCWQASVRGDREKNQIRERLKRKKKEDHWKQFYEKMQKTAKVEIFYKKPNEQRTPSK